MSLTRGEAALLFVLTALPALLVVADGSLYARSVPVLLAPAAAALTLVCLGLYAAWNRSRPAEPHMGRIESLSLLPLIGSVAALLLLGPRLGLPTFALVFARRNGANWPRAAGAAAVCALVVEVLLVRLLEQPLPLLPLLRWYGF
jgi:hypothetical protein